MRTGRSALANGLQAVHVRAQQPAALPWCSARLAPLLRPPPAGAPAVLPAACAHLSAAACSFANLPCLPSHVKRAQHNPLQRGCRSPCFCLADACSGCLQVQHLREAEPELVAELQDALQALSDQPNGEASEDVEGLLPDARSVSEAVSIGPLHRSSSPSHDEPTTNGTSAPVRTCPTKHRQLLRVCGGSRSSSSSSSSKWKLSRSLSTLSLCLFACVPQCGLHQPLEMGPEPVLACRIRCHPCRQEWPQRCQMRCALGLGTGLHTRTHCCITCRSLKDLHHLQSDRADVMLAVQAVVSCSVLLAGAAHTSTGAPCACATEGLQPAQHGDPGGCVAGSPAGALQGLRRRTPSVLCCDGCKLLGLTPAYSSPHQQACCCPRNTARPSPRASWRLSVSG